MTLMTRNGLIGYLISNSKEDESLISIFDRDSYYFRRMYKKCKKYKDLFTPSLGSIDLDALGINAIGLEALAVEAVAKPRSETAYSTLPVKHKHEAESRPKCSCGGCAMNIGVEAFFKTVIYDFLNSYKPNGVPLDVLMEFLAVHCDMPFHKARDYSKGYLEKLLDSIVVYTMQGNTKYAAIPDDGDGLVFPFNHMEHYAGSIRCFRHTAAVLSFLKAYPKGVTNRNLIDLSRVIHRLAPISVIELNELYALTTEKIPGTLLYRRQNPKAT